ncbi:MAG: beta-ketoacyl-ACP synthase [Geothrix sp.]|uniref:beta-ketoacyl-ACP synthase n=1 Tax=Geothrix sp. TaxID=1962974 RepID=UPI00183A30A6|nr:beta-ketoacyl-ACP synthase [Geothrix sp.]NWJ41191.1 beta-ketoacyl-ACP synthase [Geothrix sp.]WIL20818.1 MAG: beta-ketoacyl-ACP synthase [Geothrix sp.]
MHRVVVTGMGGVTPLGDSWEAIGPAMEAGRSGVKTMTAWDQYPEIQTRLGVPIEHFDVPEHYPRKMVRSMGRVALLGVRATELALADAGLLGDPILRSGHTGVAYGSSFGSVEPMVALGKSLAVGRISGIGATGYIQAMSHTAAVNIGVFFGLTGRVIPTSTACTSSSQAIGYAYETIQQGRQTVMIAGGCDELTIYTAAVFDTLYATSLKNDTPEATPRPFDTDRDGLVVGEGGCTLILEDRDHALARGARIYAEVLGFGTNSDGAHITQPQKETMAETIRLALRDADLRPEEVDWVNAHGTATEHGDIAESHATFEVFQRPIPIVSFKSYFGHPLGACGSIEAWVGIHMTLAKRVAPTLNLVNPDPRCAELDYIQTTPRHLDATCFVSNNFAFGGINTALVFRCPA